MNRRKILGSAQRLQTLAPNLWKIIPEAQRAEVELTAKRASMAQEYAPSGFYGGTNHGPSHIDSVLKYVDIMVCRAGIDKQHYNSTEAFLLANATILHDVASFKGRLGHADAARIENIAEQDHIPLEPLVLKVASAIAAAHSGPKTIEELPRDKSKLLTNLPKCDMRKIAATLRFADEIAEGPDRTSPSIIASEILPTVSKPYHIFSDIVQIELPNDGSALSVEITASRTSLRELCGAADNSVTLLSFVLDKLVKMEEERQYCARFVPGLALPSSIVVRIRESSLSDPWYDRQIPSKASEFRETLYSQDPELLFPLKNNTNPDFDVVAKCALRECFRTSLVALVKYGSSVASTPSGCEDRDLLAIVDRSFSGSPRKLVRQVVLKLEELFHSRVDLDLMSYHDFMFRFAYGDPFTVAASVDGKCLMDSQEFLAPKQIASQPLAFDKKILSTQLLDAASLEVNFLREKRTKFEQNQSFYRAISMFAQVLLLRANASPEVSVNDVYKLAKINSVREGLVQLQIPPELLATFDNTALKFKNGTYANDTKTMNLPDAEFTELNTWITVVKKSLEDR